MNQLLRYIKSLINPRKRSGTVRYMFSAVISIAVLLGAAVITSTEVSYVRLEASETAIKTGDRFYLDVYAYAHVPVNAIDITLRFDENLVEVIGVDTGQSVLTIWTQEPIIESDKVILQGGTFKKGFLREHKIAKVNLKAKQTGQGTVAASEVMLLAGDGEGTPVETADAIDSNVNLFIYDQNTDPGSIGVDVKVNILTDINGDGKVTLKDISVFMSAWNNKNKIYDFNGDGRMTFRDFSIILSDFFFK